MLFFLTDEIMGKNGSFYSRRKKLLTILFNTSLLTGMAVGSMGGAIIGIEKVIENAAGVFDSLMYLVCGSAIGALSGTAFGNFVYNVAALGPSEKNLQRRK